MYKINFLNNNIWEKHSFCPFIQNLYIYIYNTFDSHALHCLYSTTSTIDPSRHNRFRQVILSISVEFIFCIARRLKTYIYRLAGIRQVGGCGSTKKMCKYSNSRKERMHLNAIRHRPSSSHVIICSTTSLNSPLDPPTYAHYNVYKSTDRIDGSTWPSTMLFVFIGQMHFWIIEILFIFA